MSEMKGAMIGMFLFVAVIIPAVLFIGIGSLHQHAFIKISTEVTEIVKEEGGVTDRVAEVASSLSERGYTIVFKNDEGNQIGGKRDFGETIIVDFNYKYHNVRGEQELNTENVVFVNRR